MYTRSNCTRKLCRDAVHTLDYNVSIFSKSLQSAHKARIRQCLLARFLILLEQIPRNKVPLHPGGAGKLEASINASTHPTHPAWQMKQTGE